MSRRFVTDVGASSAVEFAIIAFPFLVTVLAVIQIGIFHMAQASLDTGVIQAADTLVAQFNGKSTPVIPNLRALVAARSGGLVHDTSTTLWVELQPYTNLAATAVPIGNTTDAGGAYSLLALRAQASVASVVPLFPATLMVRSAALLRRQAY